MYTSQPCEVLPCGEYCITLHYQRTKEMVQKTQLFISMYIALLFSVDLTCFVHF